MSDILSGQLLINGVDVWEEYGVFLTEKQRGGCDNLSALLQPCAGRSHVGVELSDVTGKSYSSSLDVSSQERDFTLHFAQYAPTRSEWLSRYRSFITFLKEGADGSGWLELSLPTLGMTLKVFYVEGGTFEPLTSLWSEGVQASRYKIKFKEPQPQI